MFMHVAYLYLYDQLQTSGRPVARGQHKSTTNWSDVIGSSISLVFGLQYRWYYD